MGIYLEASDLCRTSWRPVSATLVLLEWLLNIASHAALANRRPEQGESIEVSWVGVLTSQRFRTYLFDSGRAPDIIGYILVICLEYKDDQGTLILSPLSCR